MRSQFPCTSNFTVTPCRVGLLLWTLLIHTELLAVAERAPFPPIFNTQPETIPLQKPTDVAANMTLPPGFSATVFAAEPEVQQPIAITTDSRGRLWVAENYTYSENAVNFHPDLRDRIVIFEDTDHDGRADRRTVFWDQGRKLTGIAVGFGGVYALCAPNLVFIPDRNGDDVPDSEPQILLDGWNDNVTRHTIVNGLKWGPDGWLYGRQGIQATSEVGKPGSAKMDRTPINVGLWRFHPITHVFEVVCDGTTNPWGHDWDDYGQLFFINTVIGHLWHVIPGAHYRRMYGEHFNPHLYEVIEQTADHFHWDTREVWSEIRKIGVSDGTSKAGGGHAHSGLMIYLGDNWPDTYRNSVFAVNYHGKRINQDRIERRGAGYVGLHAPDLMLTSDPWFRGIDLLSGSDGGVFVADWSDIGECHDHDGIHRTSGRIYKIAYQKPSAPPAGDLRERSDAELVALQLHRNDWFVRQSRLILQERAAQGRSMTAVHAELQRLMGDSTDVTRQLRLLWALHATAGLDQGRLMSLLNDPNEHLRIWAIQLLTDPTPPSHPLIDRFSKMATTDPSGLVLSFLASAMGKAGMNDRWLCSPKELP